MARERQRDRDRKREVSCVWFSEAGSTGGVVFESECARVSVCIVFFPPSGSEARPPLDNKRALRPGAEQGQRVDKAGWAREEKGRERGKNRGEKVSRDGSRRQWEEAEQLWYLEQV